MNRQERQAYLIDRKHFVCHCQFCLDDSEDEKDFQFYGMLQEFENLKKEQVISFDAHESFEVGHPSLHNSIYHRE